ncbi:hypothetical protein [Amycolatopsis sp. NPDC051372]|uniref:hypothetical protein n=1 Tax=Amycolatopsis sp. NPDC051372 TaxID=3155669 RepID=UPI00341518E6
MGIDAGLRKLGELRARRAIDTCDDAAAMAGIPTDEMLTAILATEGLLDLFGVCVEASARTPLRVKRRILARLLAEGYGEAGQSKLENRVYMARILNDLEQPHFAILSELASVETPTLVGLANLLDPPQFVDSTLSVLISNGLVRGVDQFLSPQYPTSYSNLDDEPSVAGRKLRDHSSGPGLLPVGGRCDRTAVSPASFNQWGRFYSARTN